MSILPPLLEKGARVQVHDPQGMDEARKMLPDFSYHDSPYAACEGADAVVLMTEWNQYRALDLARIREAMRDTIFIDLRNVYDPEKMKKMGFSYVGVGRGE